MIGSALRQMGPIGPDGGADDRVARIAGRSLSCPAVAGLIETAAWAADSGRGPIEVVEGAVVSEENSNLGRDVGQSTGGYEMVFSGVLFSLAGLWLDRQLGWTPILTIVLAIVGFAGGVASVYYRYKRDIARIEAETAALRRAGS